MKKTLSLLLALAMILSLSIVLATTISAATVEGDWNVYTGRGQYKEENNPEMKPTPGYEYTDDGLHMIPADWSTSSPWGIFQTKEKVDLRQGVYMEVRIDDFTYTAADKWFGFNIWTEQIDEFPYEEDKQALGLEALIRINEEKKITSIPLNIHTEIGQSTVTSAISATNAQNKFDENGCPIVTLQITWDKASGYSMIVNGAEMSANNCSIMTEFLNKEENEGQAYISFSLQNSEKGGTVECTVLKFGTSPENCQTPMGDDSADPIENRIVIADIASPDTVPYGDPAVFVTGSETNSDLLMFPKSTNNSQILINDDETIKVTTTSSWASISMSVAHEVSYDAANFPIMMTITRNLCTCVWQDGFPSCTCGEIPSVITMAGDTISEGSGNTVRAESYLWEPYVDAEGNMYSYFISDWSDYIGRINGFRIDIQGIRHSELGRNTFDICGVAFFRDLDEAKSFFDDYISEIEGDEENPDLPDDSTGDNESESEKESEGVEAGDKTETDTQENIEKETETSAEVSDDGNETTDEESETSEAPTEDSDHSGDYDETEAPTDKETDKGADKNTEDKDNDSEKKSGCKVTLGAGSAAIICMVISGFALLRKKEK